ATSFFCFVSHMSLLYLRCFISLVYFTLWLICHRKTRRKVGYTLFQAQRRLLQHFNSIQKNRVIQLSLIQLQPHRKITVSAIYFHLLSISTRKKKEKHRAADKFSIFHVILFIYPMT